MFSLWIGFTDLCLMIMKGCSAAPAAPTAVRVLVREKLFIQRRCTWLFSPSYSLGSRRVILGMLVGTSMPILFRNIYDPVTQKLKLFLMLQIYPLPKKSNKLQKLFPSMGKYFISSVLKSLSTSFVEHPGVIIWQDQRERALLVKVRQLGCT